MTSVHTKNVDVVNAIFESNTNDLTYILSSDELINKHIKFITNTSYATSVSPTSVRNIIVNTKTGAKPKCFCNFAYYYKYIYQRWVHMIRSCYDINYQYYKYFGAKGIRVSKKFLDGKQFCIWCLKNGLTKKPFTYTQYLQRKNKCGDYSPNNCYVITEKELHECKSLKLALSLVILLRQYEAEHDKSVSYMTFHTRYYAYDLDLYDACKTPYITRFTKESIGFRPIDFYKDVADENSCSLNTFVSRMHYSYLMPNFIGRPYDMLNPNYSVSLEANKQGILSYKQQWDIEQKEKAGNGKNSCLSYNNTYNGVYKSTEDDDVYIKNDDIYSDDG